LWFALVLALGVTAGAASAQDADRGSWWAVGVGAGGTRLTCDFCDAARDVGGSVDFAMGLRAGAQGRLGIEVGGWSHHQEDVRESVLRAGVVGQLHPRPGSGLHLIGGLGWSGYRASDLASDVVRVSLGVGWDLPIPVGSRWTVGNSLVLDAASFGRLRSGETSVAGEVGFSVLRFGAYVRRR